MIGPNQTAAPRRKTRQIRVGSVLVGGEAPISVQSMTITKTADAEGTLQQIYALAGAGADIVRCTCNEEEAAEGLARIVPRSPVPIVADIHHQYKMALAALDAGVHGLRLNPGNIRNPEHIKAVARECKDRGVPIRIGVNAGSLDKDLYEKYGGRVTPEAMVESAMLELAYFAEVGFEDVKFSVKASNVPIMPFENSVRNVELVSVVTLCGLPAASRLVGISVSTAPTARVISSTSPTASPSAPPA